MRLLFLLLSCVIGSAITNSVYQEMIDILKARNLVKVEKYLGNLLSGGWTERLNFYLHGLIRKENINHLLERIDGDMKKGLPYSQHLDKIQSSTVNNGLDITIPMLDAYLNRIQYPYLNGETFSPTVEVLDELIFHHASNIPVDSAYMTLQNAKVSLNINDIFQRLVNERRGGYCYQRNLLLAAILSKLGFEVRLGNARMAVYNEDGSYVFVENPSHSILFVNGPDGIMRLVDVNPFAKSIPIHNGEAVTNQHGVTCSVRLSGKGENLYELVKDGRVQYSFTTDAASVEDYIHDKERIRLDTTTFFNKHLAFVIPTKDGTASIVDTKFSTVTNGVKETKTIENGQEFKKLLLETFAIILTKEEMAQAENRLFEIK
jgi:N-hydroxyarylamine O-acetyltransferase